MGLDHITPRSHDGDNTSENLVTACRSCNSARGNKSVADYAPGGAQERIAVQIKLPVNIALAKSILTGESGYSELEDLR